MAHCSGWYYSNKRCARKTAAMQMPCCHFVLTCRRRDTVPWRGRAQRQNRAALSNEHQIRLQLPLGRAQHLYRTSYKYLEKNRGCTCSAGATWREAKKARKKDTLSFPCSLSYRRSPATWSNRVTDWFTLDFFLSNDTLLFSITAFCSWIVILWPDCITDVIKTEIYVDR